MFHDDIKIITKTEALGIRCVAINNSKSPIYVPKPYHIRKANDSIIMEAISIPKKGDVEISYNVFMPPIMSKLLVNKNLSFYILDKDYEKYKKVKVYFKIYDQDYIETLGNGRFTSSLSEFIYFDKRHSKLIPATLSMMPKVLP